MSEYTGPGHFVGKWSGKIGGAVAGDAVGGIPGGIVGYEVGERVGERFGKHLDKYCENEGKKIQAEYTNALKAGLNKHDATQYALHVTGWNDD